MRLVYVLYPVSHLVSRPRDGAGVPLQSGMATEAGLARAGEPIRAASSQASDLRRRDVDQDQHDPASRLGAEGRAPRRQARSPSGRPRRSLPLSAMTASMRPAARGPTERRSSRLRRAGGASRPCSRLTPPSLTRSSVLPTSGTHCARQYELAAPGSFGHARIRLRPERHRSGLRQVQKLCCERPKHESTSDLRQAERSGA